MAYPIRVHQTVIILKTTQSVPPDVTVGVISTDFVNTFVSQTFTEITTLSTKPKGTKSDNAE